MNGSTPQESEFLLRARRDAMMERFAAFAMQAMLRVQRHPKGLHVECDCNAAWSVAEAMCLEWERRCAERAKNQ